MPIPERVYVPSEQTESPKGISPAPKDPSKGHFYVSLVKSVLRIGAGGSLLYGNLLWAGALLIVAELLGILEELV
jgi:hypothetical protein